MNNSKIIDDARSCAEQLKTAGLSDWEKKIVNAIESGSTGGEIVMALKWNLQELLKLQTNLPAPTRELAQKIVYEINATGW